MSEEEERRGALLFCQRDEEKKRRQRRGEGGEANRASFFSWDVGASLETTKCGGRDI